jgi:hypothetical protein
MRHFQRWFPGLGLWMVIACVLSQRVWAQEQPAMAEQLFALANQARAQVGAGALTWDPALAEAARRHCARMVAEGPIAHRYGGEQSLEDRAAAAGAHFSLIEENLAVGQYPEQIQQGWMNSEGHRENLLNREVDRVGIAVIAHEGALYAVADFSQGVQAFSAEQAEDAVAGLMKMSGIRVLTGTEDARGACAMDHGLPARLHGGQPAFMMRWQSTNLGQLPQPLVDRLGSGQFKQAAVGSCPAEGAQPGFTVYRVAVLLY